jgi:hypothetical protein
VRLCTGPLSILIAISTVSTQSPGQAASQPPLYGGNAQTAPAQQQSGSATAGVFAPVLDAEKRPITAGGFVKTGPVVFQDISEKAGLTVFQHKMGTPEKKYILETIGSGVALLDYDHDGWLEIYIVNGSTFDALNDQVFEILITTTRSDDPILTHDELRIRINTAAEQVSGNLF